MGAAPRQFSFAPERASFGRAGRLVGSLTCDCDLALHYSAQVFCYRGPKLTCCVRCDHCLSVPFLLLQLYRPQRIRHASACCIPGTMGTGCGQYFVQPLDGSPGRQVTDFTSENISPFQWAPDGKTLAVARVHDTSDVVMLSEK